MMEPSDSGLEEVPPPYNAGLHRRLSNRDLSLDYNTPIKPPQPSAPLLTVDEQKGVDQTRELNSWLTTPTKAVKKLFSNIASPYSSNNPLDTSWDSDDIDILRNSLRRVLAVKYQLEIDYKEIAQTLVDYKKLNESLEETLKEKVKVIDSYISNNLKRSDKYDRLYSKYLEHREDSFALNELIDTLKSNGITVVDTLDDQSKRRDVKIGLDHIHLDYQSHISELELQLAHMTGLFNREKTWQKDCIDHAIALGIIVDPSSASFTLLKDGPLSQEIQQMKQQLDSMIIPMTPLLDNQRYSELEVENAKLKGELNIHTLFDITNKEHTKKLQSGLDQLNAILESYTRSIDDVNQILKDKYNESLAIDDISHTLYLTRVAIQINDDDDEEDALKQVPLSRLNQPDYSWMNANPAIDRQDQELESTILYLLLLLS